MKCITKFKKKKLIAQKGHGSTRKILFEEKFFRIQFLPHFKLFLHCISEVWISVPGEMSNS